jgi:Uma2 family endonuclease
LKVGLNDSRKFFYPDVTVVCGESQYYDDRRDIILNPGLIAEVLSHSTEAFDRGAKFEAYRSAESLREYILISQERPLVEQFVRNGDGRWTYQPAGVLGSSLTLTSIECTLSLNAVYDKVDFNS